MTDRGDMAPDRILFIVSLVRYQFTHDLVTSGGMPYPAECVALPAKQRELVGNACPILRNPYESPGQFSE